MYLVIDDHDHASPDSHSLGMVDPRYVFNLLRWFLGWYIVAMLLLIGLARYREGGGGGRSGIPGALPWLRP